MVLQRVDILQPLFQRFKKSTEADIKRGLVYGFPGGEEGTGGTAVAIALVCYTDTESLTLAARSLPYGLKPIGLVEFGVDEHQDLYEVVEGLEHPVLFKVVDEKVTASTGLDFLTVVHLNVISADVFWEKHVCTFHVRGKFLLTSLLEIPELEECIAMARSRLLSQAAYVLGKKERVTLLPRHGYMAHEIESFKTNAPVRISDLVKGIKALNGEDDDKNSSYFRPGINSLDITMLYDQTKANSMKKATLLISDKTPWCKLFEHYLDMDFLVVLPPGLPVTNLYGALNRATVAQLKFGFHANIVHQLGNSITAEKPVPFHFWPSFAQHPITALYAEHTSEEKLRELRHELHALFFVKETRPYFRRPAALFQNSDSLVSPHVTLRGKYSETALVNGHYEYKHYTQDNFNDDGWGCAYRSLQSIVSWFHLQGFTSRQIPTHKEIQECLVSLGDKPASFVNSKQWIGSTEVGFVLEALLGVSCRILSMSSGAEMASSDKVAALQHHFKVNGTPVMVGGGVLAHTIIGISFNPEVESEVQFLVLDPHYTGSDDLKTILNKGWVGWKDKKFWSPKDFYNICMPILPATI